MRWGASAAVAAAVLLSSATAWASAAVAACSDAAAAGEAESERMQSQLVQARAQILKGRGGGLSAKELAGGGPSAATIASFLRTRESTELRAEQRASLITPIAWFHVPKTGSSIINTFVHTPAICPTYSADDYVWDMTRFTYAELHLKGNCTGGFSKSYGFEAYDANCRVGGGHHVGIGGFSGESYQHNRGHFVAMLRQPEQRLFSQYYHYGPKELWNGTVNVWPFQTESPSLLEYAEWNAGATVRQLTRDSCLPFMNLPLPTSEDVSVAIDILKEGFVFVGITEQWALSVCLFRAMFGGPCASSDFGNVRPGEYSNSSGYDTSELNGWVDAWDGPLYAEATSIFDSTRNVYGVDAEWCASFCQGHLDEPV